MVPVGNLGVFVFLGFFLVKFGFDLVDFACLNHKGSSAVLWRIPVQKSTLKKT